MATFVVLRLLLPMKGSMATNQAKALTLQAFSFNPSLNLRGSYPRKPRIIPHGCTKPGQPTIHNTASNKSLTHFPQYTLTVACGKQSKYGYLLIHRSCFHLAFYGQRFQLLSPDAKWFNVRMPFENLTFLLRFSNVSSKWPPF